MGYLRFSLMFAVVYTHLMQGVAGMVAVYGFYVLSGFLITLVISDVYRDPIKGRALFLANRALRIYPIYWASIAVCILCHMLTNDTAGAFCFDCKVPATYSEWARDISLIGIIRFFSMPELTISNVSWTLSNELFFYVLIGLISGRSRQMTNTLFGLSLFYAHYLSKQDYAYLMYFSIPGTAHAFFFGGVLYHARHERKRFGLGHAALLLALANLILYWPIDPQWHTGPLVGIYGRLLPLGYIVLSLWQLSQQSRMSRLERWLEDITYPIYLIHTLVAAALLYRFFGGYGYGWEIMLAGFGASFALSALMLLAIDTPLKPLRRKLRQSALGTAKIE